METFEDKAKNKVDDAFVAADEAATGIKQKLGQLGRRIKRVDLRSQIVDHPFPAIGIAAAVGALVGLARPMPRRSRISGALMAVASTIGFRVLREAAMVQLASYAKQYIGGQKDASEGLSAQAPQAGTSTSGAY
jgi:hypothetical protein